MVSTSKEEKVKERWWDGVLPQVLLLISQIFFVVVVTGMVLYLAAQYKKSSFQPFELATVAGLIGGFPLVASFGDKIEAGMKKRLKLIGGLYLFSTIMLVVFGFYQAADQAGLLPSTGSGVWMFTVIYAVTFYGGAFAFTIGMWMTLELIPQLVGLGGFMDRIRRIFTRGKKVKQR